MRDELTTETTLGDHNYRVAKMSPLIAVRIHGWLMAAAIAQMRAQASMPRVEAREEPEPAPEQISERDPQKDAEDNVGMIWVEAATLLSEETVTKIQNYSLQVCSYFQTGSESPVPVQMKDGRIAAPGLIKDPASLGALIVKSLQFNISPFFIVPSSSGQVKT